MRYFSKDVLPFLLTLIGIGFLLTIAGPKDLSQYVKPVVEALLP